MMERRMNFDYARFWDETMMKNYATPGIFIERGSGCRVFDTAGKEYLDFLAGLAVASTGHSHPMVAEAVAKQARELIHTSNLYGNVPQLRLAHRLLELIGPGKMLFVNSGTEANEAAIKLARSFGHRKGVEAPEIIAFENSFHGRTLGSLAATGQPKYQEGFGPLPSGFRFARFNDLASVAAQVTDDTVAIMVEPVQGEAGVYPAHQEFLRGLRDLCDKRDILLILDEVQTGIGRTGAMFAFQRFGIRPDIVTMAKGLASGVPIGAIHAEDEVAANFKPGDHGCTFGGNPLSTAAALATLDIIEEEGLVENAKTLGEYMFEELAIAIGEQASEIRGMGLLCGVELTGSNAKATRKTAESHGLLVGSIGESVLRLAPPLIVTKGEVDEAVEKLRTALRPPVAPQRGKVQAALKH
jgi:predicted acetylornithine/succinylornithine family transaminase